MKCDEEKLVKYACEQFEKEEYDAALEAFVLAYQKGYELEWVLENIYNCYMVGNEETFRNTFQEMADMDVAYEDCLLDFIPYREGEYFIFDKEECIFRGVFSISAFKNTEPDSIFKEYEFSGVALALNWDFRDKQSILTTAWERKIYIVCHDIKRCLSFWKIPELKEYLKNIKVFMEFNQLQEYFHIHTSEYLPMVIHGNVEESKELARIRDEEHRYRLTKEGRNKENVLLTIAIPTANRGNLVLKRMENLLSMPYDAEIEIVVSKNCNQFYEAEYTQVSKIKDERLYYYDHKKDLHGYENFHYAVEMSCGKYVILMSDEDDVIINAIEHYLRLLSDNPALAVVRSRSDYQASEITKRHYGKKGLDAFDVIFLGQNYLSGLIVRRNDFIEADFTNSLKRFASNRFFQLYPHECWCDVLCQRGDALEEPVLLVHEGRSVREEEEKRTGKNVLMGFGSYESRLQQLQGQIEFLCWLMKDDKKGLEVGMNRILNKVSFLLRLARSLGYDDSNYMESLNQYVSICIGAVEEMPLDEEQKIGLLNQLKECFLYNVVMDAQSKGDEINERHSG